MADPKIYDLNTEDAYYKQRVGPYVMKEDRMQSNYANKYPLGIDRYRVDFKRPTVNYRSVNADSLTEDIRNGFSRLGYEAKQQWAFAPAENYRPFNIAAANKHPGGKVGVTGELITEDIDPNLGGAYAVDMTHCPPVQCIVDVQSVSKFHIEDAIVGEHKFT